MVPVADKWPLRRAARRDLKALCELQRRTQHRFWDLSTWEIEYERDSGVIWVVDGPREAKIIAYLVAWRVLDTVEIVDLAVAPDYRRRSVASTMLDTLAVLAAASGASQIALEVAENNRAAVGFYENRGFQHQGRRSAFYADGEEAILMSFELSDS